MLFCPEDMENWWEIPGCNFNHGLNIISTRLRDEIIPHESGEDYPLPKVDVLLPLIHIGVEGVSCLSHFPRKTHGC